MSDLPRDALGVDRMFVRAMNEHDIETVMKTYDESTVFVQGPGRENVSTPPQQSGSYKSGAGCASGIHHL
jgi:ketosteroid isomerase-like protein